VGIEEVNWFGQVARPCIDRINEPIKSPQTCMHIIGGGFWFDYMVAVIWQKVTTCNKTGGASVKETANESRDEL